MNNDLFQQARTAYAIKDFTGALGAFTQCLQDPAAPPAEGELGLLYHQIGNCLVKCKNYKEAIQAYTQALSDEVYESTGMVNYNLGMAYAALHDYDNAITRFEQAVADPDYSTPYKAYSAMGNALMKVGKSAEAGVAFREAALDEANPDPTKALLNLGVCFMALNRPEDAVVSYESALQFRMDNDTKNKLYANLGQAYCAAGQMQKATKAFEEALADRTYFLSDSASVDYQRAIAAVAQGTEEIAQVPSTDVLGAGDTSGLDVVSEDDRYLVTGMQEYDPDIYYNHDQEIPVQPTEGVPYEGQAPVIPTEGVEGQPWGTELEIQTTKKHGAGFKFLIFIIILLILAIAAGIFGYTQGYGWPMQDSVAKQLFADPDNATNLFAEDLGEAKAASLASSIVKDANPTIDGVNRSMNESEVYVTGHTDQGGEVKYRISMVRDMIGWKISDVEFYFTSQQ